VSIERHSIEISGMSIEVVRKDIKNLHVGVYPPQGRVRVAVPLRLSDDGVRLALISRLGWIQRQRRAFLEQERQSEREMVTGETHYLDGRRVRLKVIPHDGPSCVELRGHRTLILFARPQLDAAQRFAVLERWYRERIKEQVGDLVTYWSKRLGLPAPDWGIKKMKTRWGTCNQSANRIWINLELAKKPVQCLEYIVVHELVHLLERHHNDRFAAILGKFMPDWQLRRDVLNNAPLAHQEWVY
jgi:predicted metal-dependent hydrolase